MYTELLLQAMGGIIEHELAECATFFFFFLLECATVDSEFHANGQFLLDINYWISILRSNFNEGKKKVCWSSLKD